MPNTPDIRLLIADDHQLLLDSLTTWFDQVEGLEVVGRAKNGLEVLKIVKETAVDVVLMDINMPELNGIMTCKKLTKSHPLVKVIALSMYREASYVKRMKSFGAKGYVLKDDSAEEMTTAIRAVHDGKEYYSSQLKDLIIDSLFTTLKPALPTITRREKEVLEKIAAGYSNNKIATLLFISAHTVDSHRKNLLAKFEAKNSAELVSKAMEQGLL